jgi:hypothetical protein
MPSDGGERRWGAVSTGEAVAALVGLGLLALLLATDGDGYIRILDDANLAFHEAGHVVFGILGSTMGLYGGTLGQLVFPLAGSIAFGVRRQPIGLAVCVAWLGENLLNIARYVADARKQELPLAGGGEHDWTNILLRWNALTSETKVAGVFRTCGWLLILAAIGFVIWRAWGTSGSRTPSRRA